MNIACLFLLLNHSKIGQIPGVCSHVSQRQRLQLIIVFIINLYMMWSSLLFICIVMQSQLSWQLVMTLKKIYIPKKEKKMNQKQHWCKITLGKDAAL